MPLFSPIYSSTRPYSQTRSNTQRALMQPDEILRMDNRECIVLLRGQKPMLLYKIIPDEFPLFKTLHTTPVSEHIPAWRESLDQPPPQPAPPPAEEVPASKSEMPAPKKEAAEPQAELQYEYDLLSHGAQDIGMVELTAAAVCGDEDGEED